MHLDLIRGEVGMRVLNSAATVWRRAHGATDFPKPTPMSAGGPYDHTHRGHRTASSSTSGSLRLGREILKPLAFVRSTDPLLVQGPEIATGLIHAILCSDQIQRVAQ